jgi:hypothetical protein
MKTVARVLLTLVIVAAGCAGGYELWDYYHGCKPTSWISPRT